MFVDLVQDPYEPCRKTKIGTGVGHVTRYLDTTLKVKRITCGGGGISWRLSLLLTSVRRIQRLEEDGEESRRVLSGVDDVWKRQPSVAISAKALGKPEPGR